MGRPEKIITVTDEITAFAADLRRLRASAGGLTYRQLAQRTHYSHTTLTDATAGRQLPSLPVLLAFVEACGGDCLAWQRRWETLRGNEPARPTVLPAWPEQPAADGAEPESAGCGVDAATLTARKVSQSDRQLLLGQIELRHSPSRHAVWGRFEGYGTLEHLARTQSVEIQVEIIRYSDAARVTARDPFCFDYHWCNMLILDKSPVRAEAMIFVDDRLIGQGATPAWPN
ncbi:helix-turn-helix domain-containing protein [Rhizocola hellebori]|uniref:helix-turn-helix domain-containing protein n=1 Tax=Rhizocola hellebori TaxID=1392758 RepID=UPI001945167C|nr:XRE family transcriptional regulator [Rhizocola hellebori]